MLPKLSIKSSLASLAAEQREAFLADLTTAEHERGKDFIETGRPGRRNSEAV